MSHLSAHERFLYLIRFSEKQNPVMKSSVLIYLFCFVGAGETKGEETVNKAAESIYQKKTTERGSQRVH